MESWMEPGVCRCPFDKCLQRKSTSPGSITRYPGPTKQNRHWPHPIGRVIQDMIFQVFNTKPDIPEHGLWEAGPRPPPPRSVRLRNTETCLVGRPARGLLHILQRKRRTDINRSIGAILINGGGPRWVWSQRDNGPLFHIAHQKWQEQPHRWAA